MIRRGRNLAWTRFGAEYYANGLFGIPGLRQAEDFERIAIQRVDHAREVMTKWRDLSNSDLTQSVEVLDNVSNSLCRIADAAEFIRNVHHDSKWIDGATRAVEAVSTFMNEANVDSGLYQRAKSVMDEAKSHLPGNNEHTKVISAMVVAMENEGVALESTKKERLIALQESDIIKSFNIIKGVGDTEELPGEWIELDGSMSKTENWSRLLSTKRNSKGRNEVFIPSGNANIVPHLLRDIKCRSTREALWDIGNRRTKAVREKEKSLHDLISIRREQAEIRGYPSWNDYAQRESILTPVGGPRAVEKFLADLWTDLCPGLAREIDVLSDLNGGKPVERWDLDFLIQEWKNNHSSAVASTQAIQSKMTFQRIMRGGQMVFDKVLGIDMQYDASAGRLWNKDAFRLSLTREAGKPPFAHLYMDPYHRDSKAVQSAQFTIAGSKVMQDGHRQLPQTALVLGLPNDATVPLPISVSQTFFHELGHAAHSLLSETHLQHFSGSRGAIDFVEFPSHLFEFFGTDPVCLEAHLGSEVHASYFYDYARNRNPFAHLEVAQQLAYALLDQVYYSSGSPLGVSDHLPDTPLLNKSQTMSLLIPSSTANFEHLVHYGGSYYSYLLCRSIASDVWNKSFKANPFNRKMGERLEAFLKGGSVDQSIESIYGVLTDVPDPHKMCRKAFIEDLKSCTAIHGL